MYENELYHHGIKGMKWGVRRFQTKDGGLTSAGRKRYSDAEQNYRDAKAARKQANREHRKAFNKASTLTGAYGKRSAEYNRASMEAAKKANKADANYKKAKAAYKAEKKSERDAKAEYYKTPEGKKELRRKAVKIGAAVAVTAAAAYGAKKVYEIQQDKKIEAGKIAANKAINQSYNTLVESLKRESGNTIKTAKVYDDYGYYEYVKNDVGSSITRHDYNNVSFTNKRRK